MERLFWLVLLLLLFFGPSFEIFHQVNSSASNRDMKNCLFVFLPIIE